MKNIRSATWQENSARQTPSGRYVSGSLQVRRGAVRLAALALLTGLLLGIFVPKLFAAGDDSHSGAVRTHVVSNGETLWSVAQKHAADDDPRRFIHDLTVLNGLEGGAIFPGQRLVLPPS